MKYGLIKRSMLGFYHSRTKGEIEMSNIRIIEADKKRARGNNAVISYDLILLRKS